MFILHFFAVRSVIPDSFAQYERDPVFDKQGRGVAIGPDRGEGEFFQ
jgi:hypothetical protein